MRIKRNTTTQHIQQPTNKENTNRKQRGELIAGKTTIGRQVTSADNSARANIHENSSLFLPRPSQRERTPKLCKTV